jgi:hypothetical protein
LLFGVGAGIAGPRLQANGWQIFNRKAMFGAIQHGYLLYARKRRF